MQFMIKKITTTVIIISLKVMIFLLLLVVSLIPPTNQLVKNEPKKVISCNQGEDIFSAKDCIQH